MVEAPGWTPARDGTRVSVVGRKVMFGPDGWMYDWCGVYAELSFEGTGLQLQMRGSHNVSQLWLCPNQTPRAPETDPRAALWAALARHDCRDQPALPRPSGCWGRLTGSARERWREVAGAGAGGLRPARTVHGPLGDQRHDVHGGRGAALGPLLSADRQAHGLRRQPLWLCHAHGGPRPRPGRRGRRRRRAPAVPPAVGRAGRAAPEQPRGGGRRGCRGGRTGGGRCSCSATRTPRASAPPGAGAT